MDPRCLVDTYETERIKTLGVWAMFADEHMGARPDDAGGIGRSAREHMVHQCVGEDGWFRGMLGIDVGLPPLPPSETRLEFLRHYAAASERRLKRLRRLSPEWWDAEVLFFDVRRSRAWVLTRRLLHTAHHRGQLTALLRVLGRPLHSTYGPTADTGGLPLNGALTLYAYADIGALLEGEARGGDRTPLPGPGSLAGSERPDPSGEASDLHAERPAPPTATGGAEG